MLTASVSTKSPMRYTLLLMVAKAELSAPDGAFVAPLLEAASAAPPVVASASRTLSRPGGSTHMGSSRAPVGSEPFPLTLNHLSSGMRSINSCGDLTVISNEDAATVAAEAKEPIAPKGRGTIISRNLTTPFTEESGRWQKKRHNHLPLPMRFSKLRF